MAGTPNGSLETVFATKFTDEERKRGRWLFEDQKLKKVDWRNDMAYVTVRDHGELDVCVFHDSTVKTLKVSCSCERFQNAGSCEHLWATLLFADKKEGMRTPAGQLPGKFTQLKLKDQDYIEAMLDRDIWTRSDEDGDDDEPAETVARAKAPPAVAALPTEKEIPTNTTPTYSAPAPTVSAWRESLARAAEQVAAPAELKRDSFWLNHFQLVFIVAANRATSGEEFVLEWGYREPIAGGGWGWPKKTQITMHDIRKLADPQDREILSLVSGAAPAMTPGMSGYYGDVYRPVPLEFAVPVALREPVLSLAGATGRLFLRTKDRARDDQLLPVTWDSEGPWDCVLSARLEPSGQTYQILAAMQRRLNSPQRISPISILYSGLIWCEQKLSFVRDWANHRWLAKVALENPLFVPVREIDDFLAEMYRTGPMPKMELPPELQLQEMVVAPTPRICVKTGHYSKLAAEVEFDYGDVTAGKSHTDVVLDVTNRRLIRRDRAAEKEFESKVFEFGFTQAPGYRGNGLEIGPKKFAAATSALTAAGWKIESDGKLFRSAVAIDVSVKSGIDWFELHGKIDFGGMSANLPELLAALKRGDNSVALDDGSLGMLPQEWLDKYGVLAGLGTKKDDHLRFNATQVGLLDALLASQPQARFDAVFEQARDRLKNFSGIAAADPPDSFIGTLRGYQREGLGWLQFLQEFNFGGCLADDMGLGKTVQVLALLDSRRKLRMASGMALATGDAAAAKPKIGPSLVVVPKTLVFNWKQEAAKFAPELKVLDHTGIERIKANEHFEDFDLILTTYGTLRKDALIFKDVEFDYCILDEAQAIKNAATESAKAARLIQARHRLIMSGTPVENHLGELWSQFEFLNPGMLGTASVLKLGGTGARNPAPEARQLLAKALRPFILRRTKAQVAKDLPEKLEQTVYCELETDQRKLYDELRDHYRKTLLGRIDREGLAKSKMHILEALLRLRQAACHVGLLDKTRQDEPCAKLDMLLPQLQEVTDEGHKVLVFSQFTSFLAILRQRLDADGAVYEYLDGRTRDRQAKVDRFQTDPDCKLFLISLKAGGVGLNLTAADYVFLLDPWWNPAVEAQAIDRSHRIGQDKQVFAYRLIARDTVEEKVLQLQASKRNLADAIINADNSLIRGLGREDLELLLS